MAAVGSDFWSELETSAKATGTDMSLIRGIGNKESGFRNVGNSWGGSGAYGPFQFIKSTWERAVKMYPEARASDRFNPVHQARLFPYFIRGEAEALKRSTGRSDISNGDVYLAHFLGSGGAARALRAGDGAAITDAVASSSINANKSIFGKMATVGDLRKWAAAAMGGKNATFTPSSTPTDPALFQPKDQGSKITWEDLTPDTPVDDQSTRAAMLKQQEQAFGPAEAFMQQWKDNPFAHTMGVVAPDPNFHLKGSDPLYKDLTKDIPTEYHRNFGAAQSEGHARAIREQIREELGVNERYGGMSTGATIAMVGGAFTEPASLAAAFLIPEAGIPAKLGKVGRALVRGAEAGVATGALEAYRISNRQTDKATDALWAAGQGFVLGGTLGALGRNPALTLEAGSTAHLGERIKAEVLGYEFKGSTAGAAQNLTLKRDLHDDLNAWEQLQTGMTALPGIRSNGIVGDLAGQLGSSKAVTTRSVADHLVKNTVGRQGDRNAPIAFAASEIAHLEHNRAMDVIASKAKPTFTKYMEEKGVGWTGKDDAWTEFARDLTRFVRNDDPRIEFPASVTEMGTAIRKFHENWIDLAHNPGRSTGRELGFLPGFENVQKSPNYIMRQRNEVYFDEKLTQHGTDGLGAFYGRAFKNANPNVSDELAAKIGQGYVNRLSRLAAGMEDNLGGLALSTLDRGRLKGMLDEFQNLSAKEVEEIVESFHRPPSEGGPARAKHRTFFNENYAENLPTKDGGARLMTASDIFEDDAFKLMEQYSRQMSGLVGLHQVHIKNPRYAPDLNDEPEYLVAGLSRQADRDNLKALVQADHMKNNSMDKAAMQKDIDNLQFGFDQILGVGDPFDRTKTGKFLKLVRDYNVTRLMNNVGLAQIGEIGMITSSMGIKAALEGVPAFRALWRNARTGQVDDTLMKEVMEVTAYGSDFSRQLLRSSRDEQGSLYNYSAGSTGLTAENALRKGKNVTNIISGMAPINTLLQRWAGQAAFAKFANMAGGKKENMARMAQMGISPEMADRISGQIRQFAARKRGDAEISGSNLKRMNLEAWGDKEAAAHFKLATSRWARYAVLENDIGNMNRMIGSAWGKIIGQFRSFVFGAWSSHTMRNVHMRDTQAFVSMLATIFTGGLAYTARTYLGSVGRSDQQEFLEKRLSVASVAKGAFQNSSMASIIPMFVDSGLMLAGRPGVFDARTSTQPSDLFLGNPSTGLIADVAKGMQGLTSGDPSQADVRTASRVTAFGNWAPWQATLSSMISGLPEYVNHKRSAD